MEFSRPEYWSGLPFRSPGDLPNPRIEPGTPALQADSLLSEPPGKPYSREGGHQIRGAGAVWPQGSPGTPSPPCRAPPLQRTPRLLLPTGRRSHTDSLLHFPSCKFPCKACSHSLNVQAGHDHHCFPGQDQSSCSRSPYPVFCRERHDFLHGSRSAHPEKNPQLPRLTSEEQLWK